jgi:hypothetical protein
MHVGLSCCNEPVSLGLARHGPVWSNLVAEVPVAIGKSTAETRDVNASGKTSRRTQRKDVKTDATEDKRVSERDKEIQRRRCAQDGARLELHKTVRWRKKRFEDSIVEVEDQSEWNLKCRWESIKLQKWRQKVSMWDNQVNKASSETDWRRESEWSLKWKRLRSKTRINFKWNRLKRYWWKDLKSKVSEASSDIKTSDVSSATDWGIED